MSSPAPSVPTQHAPSQPTSTTTFADLGVPASLVKVLDQQGIHHPFPIQTATLPDSLDGRDVLGRGRTGSGKTLAFGLALVARLSAAGTKRRPSSPRALVLVPTRELANQVDAVIAPLARSVGLSTTTIYGGVSQGRQVSALRRGSDIVVACPGRLEDLLSQRHLRLDAVEVTVLDEADHMADLGFLPAVKRILDQTPAGGQRLLFSATLDREVDVLVRRYLVDPVNHAVDAGQPQDAAMEHHVLTVSDKDKAGVVRELASGLGQSLLFTRTKHTAKRLAQQLTDAGVPAVDLHGNLAQNARERNLAAFRSGQVRVLVATDIAARGIHVDDVALVVHVDPPTEHKAYVHRSGRTARAGAAGVVVTVATHAQRGDVAKLTKRAGIAPVTTAVVPGADAIRQLAGPPAGLVSPAPKAHRPADRPTTRRSASEHHSHGRGARGNRGGRTRRPRG